MRRALIAVVALVPLASIALGCAVTRNIQMLPSDGSAPIKAVIKGGAFSSSGPAEATLADGTFVQGKWTRLTSGVNLAMFFITTPRGNVTASALVPNGQPTGVATLSGPGVTMLCVYTGTYSSGFAYCADNDGRRYAGNW